MIREFGPHQIWGLQVCGVTRSENTHQEGWKDVHDLQLLRLFKEYTWPRNTRGRGIHKPERMTLNVMPVPPPFRPSIAIDSGSMQSEDDSTYKLGDINKASANFHVATYMDNNIADIPQALQKSARTVITGDPNLELDDVGVPKSIAMGLTYPEQDTSEPSDFRYNKRADAFLQYGQIVKAYKGRRLCVVLTAFIAQDEYALSSSVPYTIFKTPPYNADFDGDEMNMQDSGRTQSDRLGCETYSVASKNSRCGTVSSTGIKSKPFFFGSRNWMVRFRPLPPSSQNLWTGKQVLSTAISRGISISHSLDPKPSSPLFDDGALIENGELIFGNIEKKTIGASQGRLIHVVFSEKEPQATRQLFTGLQMGDLVQWVCGEGGIDGTFIQKAKIETFGLNDHKFKDNYQVEVTDTAGGSLPGVLQLSVDDSPLDQQVKLDKEFGQLVGDPRLLQDFISLASPPINFITSLFGACEHRRQGRQVRKCLVVVRGDEPLSQETQDNATLNFRTHTRATPATRRVLEKLHPTKEAFDWVVGEIKTKFNQLVAHPGEMCGTLAAQFVGEPAIQMTLNTFQRVSGNWSVNICYPRQALQWANIRYLPIARLGNQFGQELPAATPVQYFPNFLYKTYHA
ncbi:hypothetical protein CPB83DRAFT_932961 [Crepidotus variabilis]|uniref:DNA-directed RNA polymerase n=1 Tax=Crepidotus variabilis TaxID=179855 RepID=A0A9P6EFK7_9AGAR|nr:hypothetical protein CPB83DRAFT_932961 [Crepidotus variabilis]